MIYFGTFTNCFRRRPMRHIHFGSIALLAFIACSCDGTDDVMTSQRQSLEVGSADDPAPPPAPPEPDLLRCEQLDHTFPPPTDNTPSEISCWVPPQGRSQLGVPEALELAMSFSVQGAAWEPSSGTHPPIDDGGVRVTGMGIEVTSAHRVLGTSELVGLTFTTTHSVYNDPSPPVTDKLKIAGFIEPDSRGRPRYIVQRMDGNAWVPLCPNGDLAYAANGRIRIGTTADGLWLRRNYFACRDSAAAKVIRWNYSGTHADGAALRAARADYCANGQTHTFDGTRILIMDRLGYAAGAIDDDTVAPIGDAVPTEPFYFEAAWHDKVGAICLSKLRWDSLPPGGYCPTALPDPRVKGSGGVFCEDLVGPVTSLREFLASPALSGGIVFTSSQYNERTLVTWRKSDDRIVSTDHWDNSRVRNHPPAEGFFIDPVADPRIAQVATIPKPGMVMLRLYENTATHMHRTTRALLTAPWEVRQELGYVYPSIAEVPPYAWSLVVHLINYVDGTGTRYRLLRLGQPVPAGFTAVASEGYALGLF
jgi:hypothetical protein